jgi:hypothetical protein
MGVHHHGFRPDCRSARIACAAIGVAFSSCRHDTTTNR